MTTPWRAVFLDRDGTLLEPVPYLHDPAQVRLVAGAAAALRAVRDAGFLLVVVTNQSGIGRGYFAEEDFVRVMDALERTTGVLFDGVYHCPHTPDSKCSCRKPAPGMLLAAAREHTIDLARSFSVGDRDGDVLAGLAAGGRAVLLGPGPAPAGVLLAEDLVAAVEIILREAP